jgi:nicotinamidase-related amidase
MTSQADLANRRTLLTPANSTVIFIDHQPQMSFGVTSIDRQTLLNNTVALAKSAKHFKVPTILTTVETESFSGYMWPQLLDVFPGQKPIERTSMNSWDDAKFVAAVKATGRKKLVIAALWTEVCLVFPALEALAAGYEVYFVTDASGGTSKEAHDMAVQRLIQAGAVPVTWQQVLLEYQRDWARKETYDGTIEIVKEHSGAYGMGVEYAYTLVHKQKQSRKVNA